MNKIIEMVLKFSIGNKVASLIALAHDKLDGRRSEIVTAVLAIVHILKLCGIIPPEVASHIEGGLLPLLPLVMMDRVSKVIKSADKVAGQ